MSQRSQYAIMTAIALGITARAVSLNLRENRRYQRFCKDRIAEGRDVAFWEDQLGVQERWREETWWLRSPPPLE